MLLAQRNPSTNWEPIAIQPSVPEVAWVWFRPPAIPTGLMLVIPASLFADAAELARLTVRQIVAASGLDPGQILCWTMNGLTFDAVGGSSPLLDQTLPPPISGGNLDISVWMLPPQPIHNFHSPAWLGAPHALPGNLNSVAGQTMYSNGGGSEADLRLIEAIDSSWNGILQLEVRIGSIRKELGSSVARLNSLNRDLSSDERRTCDSKDIQEWSDARRWLRDSLSVLTRSVKEIDVGTTSGAGQRHKFDEIYRNHIEPKIPFPGLAQAVNEFDSYRKTVQNVVASAQANLARAGRDAEQRASSLLQKIGAKMRSSRRK